jgi:hypothetical protein
MAFAGLAAVLAASPLGVEAVWVSRLGGPEAALRLVPSQREQPFGALDGPRGNGIATVAIVPAAALPQRPERGDLIGFGGAEYTIAEVVQDPRAASFTLHLRRR